MRNVFIFISFLIGVMILLILTTLLYLPFRLFGINIWEVIDNKLDNLFQ